MLSVAPVRSASGAANYFAKDDYYTADGSAEVSGWAGEGADELGLSGQVSKDAFEGVLNGRLPDGTMVGQVENRQAGIDLTFSMPKSASAMPARSSCCTASAVIASPEMGARPPVSVRGQSSSATCVAPTRPAADTVPVAERVAAAT